MAPRSDYNDKVTNQRIPAVTTAQIYKGSIAFIILQLIMVGAIIAFPNLVTGGLEKGPVVDLDTIELEAETGGYGASDADPMRGLDMAPEPDLPAPDAGEAKEEDPMDAIKRSLEAEGTKQ